MRGHLVRVIGKCLTRKWTDRDGNERWTTEIVVAGFGGELTLLQPKPESEAA